MSSIAIMQPYFLPYVGYFQLISCVDKFIIYDDVHFINRGWINRNRLLVKNEAHLFTIPLDHPSQNKLISEIDIIKDSRWKKKLLNTIHQSYIRAPYFDENISIFEQIINHSERNLTTFIANSLYILMSALNITTEIIPTSRIYENRCKTGQDRILDICNKESATSYINPIGGIDLYSQLDFKQKGIELLFLKTQSLKYKQSILGFLEGLSILDVMMFNSIEETSQLLTKFDLIQSST